ncbi:MAG: acyl-CoA dehydrogenase family protein [Dehalococcoidia bacterium]
MTATMTREVLTEDMIGRFGERAAKYDAENTFFVEDFEELRNSGYLKMAIPEDLGGLGYSLAEVCKQQARLAYRAPATALATNMHIYWTGLAADMRKMGDSSLEWLLREAAAGEIFAAGHGEAGNDLPLFLSTTSATRVDGGYKYNGHKIFSSLTPVWTRLGVHGMDTSNPEAPEIIHAFMPRDTTGYTIKETWDTLGMRATRSDDTILDGAFVPDKYIARKLPAGSADLFVLGVFAWFEPTCASIYTAIAKRAMDLAVETAHRKKSLGLSRSFAYHPEVQHQVAEMAFRYDAAQALVQRIADEWSRGVDHGGNWPAKLVSAKHVAVEAAKDIVDRAMAISGGSGMFKGSELERLYRDVRCGGFHPANSVLAPEIVGKITLGIDLGEQPRWG